MGSKETNLRDYQHNGIEFLSSREKAILGDDMGLGKSAQAIMAIKTHPKTKTLLILCTKSGLGVWISELDKWAPGWKGVAIVIQGTPVQRRKIIESEIAEGTYIWIMTYGTFITYVNRSMKVGVRDTIPMEYDAVIADEAHKFRNRKSKTFLAMKALQTKHLYMLTGTPATRGPQDMWTYLNLCNPEQFRSYWRFVNAHCFVENGPFGRVISGVKNPVGIRQVLKPYFL